MATCCACSPGRRSPSGVPIVLAPPLAFDLPGEGVEPLIKRFVQSFGSVGSLSFVLMSFVAAAGIAASPALLSRSGTTPGVYEARKSLGWAVLVIGLVLLTLPAVAVYLRAHAARAGRRPPRRPPARSGSSCCSRRASPASRPRRRSVKLSGIGFERDAALFALPIAAGFPQVLVYLALAGALAAALAALASSLVAIAAIVAEDVVYGLPNETAPDAARIGTARVALLGAAFVTTWLAIARAGRSAAALPLVPHLRRARPPSRCCCWRSGGSAPTPGARWPA